MQQKGQGQWERGTQPISDVGGGSTLGVHCGIPSQPVEGRRREFTYSS